MMLKASWLYRIISQQLYNIDQTVQRLLITMVTVRYVAVIKLRTLH